MPSIARWVNVGETQTHYATWDIVPPATVNNMLVTDVTATTHTLQWSAPADAGDGSSGQATKYELRYRQDTQMPTLEDFFTAGTHVVGLPAPTAGGTTQTFTVTGLSSGHIYYFRLISRDGAGGDRNWSALSNQAETPQGGCPFVDTRTAAGWEVENSILGRSLTGALALDSYRLRYPPEVSCGRVRLRVRESEQEFTTLDQLRLIAIDHVPGVRAYAVGARVELGSRVPARRVTTSSGVDVTALVNGFGSGFMGGPGDTLLVEFAAASPAIITGENSTLGGGGFVEGDGGKCPPDCGSPSPFRGPADPMSAHDVDAMVLSSSGVQIQALGGASGWQTVATRYPREYYDEALFDSVGNGPLRLVFVGQHKIDFLGRLQMAAESFNAHKLPLRLAQHSRLGDVAAAIDTIGNLTSELAPGDTIHLEFGWTPVPEGQVRELMLLSRGVYTASLPASLTPAHPESFSVRSMGPNPFAVSTTLQFDLPSSMRVRLEVLDPQGRRVRVLADQYLPAGHHAIAWDGRAETGNRVGPGVYFYRFEAGDHRARGRIALVP